ncbi:HSP18 transcriptional regulator [Actinokineospora sp. NPDC004072]
MGAHYGDVPPLELIHEVAEGSGESAHVLSALIVLRHLRSRLGELEPRLIAAARELGVSWTRLAPALGVTSRQAAERRYLRLRPDGEQTTREGRVRAERDRRAGDRAVAEWARRNSAVLRGLAGQVAAVDGLAGETRRGLHDALGADDPRDLLGPLSAAVAHLRATHPGLADQITELAEQTDRVRREISDERAAKS